MDKWIELWEIIVEFWYISVPAGLGTAASVKFFVYGVATMVYKIAYTIAIRFVAKLVKKKPSEVEEFILKVLPTFLERKSQTEEMLSLLIQKQLMLTPQQVSTIENDPGKQEQLNQWQEKAIKYATKETMEALEEVIPVND